MPQRKLLLADDSVTIQKVVNLTFADEGIEVITVGDGDAAMAKLAETTPDLVMADVNMPGLNGYQICERIRQSEALRNTPVILLVGSFEPFDEAEASRVGANDYLTKPFQSIRQLVNKVTDLLETAASAEEAPTTTPPPVGDWRTGDDTAAFSAAEETGSTDLENARTLDNFEVPEEYFSATADASSSAAASETGFPAGGYDAGIDDEMIEVSPASSFVFDESAKFESREINEAEEAGAAKTQPLSAEDLQQFSFTRQAEEGNSAAGSDFARAGGTDASEEASGASRPDSSGGEQNEGAYVAAAVAAAASPDVDYQQEASSAAREEEQMAKPQTAPAFFEPGDDDDDLLEIPFDEDEEEWEEPETAEAATAAAPAGSVSDAASETQTQVYEGEAELAAAPPPTGDSALPAGFAGQTSESYAAAPEQSAVGTPFPQSAGESQPAAAASADAAEAFGQSQQQPAEQNQFAAESPATAPAAPAPQLSPEMIDAIAQKVVEKLSDRAVKDVAWEVVPQMADLIIKKMAEEKLKQ